MILLIDNFDSFTYNLFQALSILGAEVEVRRNNEISVDDIRSLRPDGIVLSPGPGGPSDAGITCDVVEVFAGNVPILGVCLGLQCIGSVFGARIVSARELVHGKTCLVQHENVGVFRGLPNPFEAVRYHSLAVDELSVPGILQVTAKTADGTIMGLRHKELGVEGVQFHPESILTLEGPKLLANFLEECVAPTHGVHAEIVSNAV